MVKELDDGKFSPETPIFDGKNPWVSGEDFRKKTNPLIWLYRLKGEVAMNFSGLLTAPG